MKPTTPTLRWLAAATLTVVLVACPPQPEPKPDTTPDPVSFTPATGTELNTVTESNQVTVQGINISVAVSITGGEYKIGAGTYTSVAGTLKSGDKIQLRTTSATTLNTAKDVQLSIGSSVFVFIVTTKSAPGDVSFTSRIDQPWATTLESNTVAVSSINPGTPITVSGGSYKLNGGAYVTAAGTVNDGDTVTVKGTSASADLTETVVTLTIGTQARTFTIKTGKRIPDDFNFPPEIDATPSATYTRSIRFSSPNITIPTPASIAGGTFTINGVPGANGDFVNPGDALVVSGVSPATADGSSQSVTLSVGGKSATFTITTKKNQAPTISFTDQTIPAPNVSAAERSWTGTTRCTIYPPAPNTDCPGLSGDPRYQQPPIPAAPTFTESNTVTLSSIDANTPFSVVNGEYSKNGGSFTSVAGTVSSGDTIKLRLNAIYPGTKHKASLTLGTTPSLTADFNVTTSSTTVQNVWTPNAATAPITIPSGGTASSTINVPSTTAKLAKVRVLVTLEGNSFKRSAHVIRLVAPTGTTLVLMDFVNTKPASSGLPAGVNPLDPRNTGSQPNAVSVPLKTGTVQERPWPWNALDFIAYGGGGGVNAIFDSSKFGTNAAAGAGQGGDFETGSGTDTYLDGGANQNDVYRRCGTDFYAVQKKKYIAYDLQAGQRQTDIDTLNVSLNRDLPRAGAIDPYTGKVDMRGGTNAAPNSPTVTGEYTDGTCSRNTGNVFYPPIVPDPRVGDLKTLNGLNPSGTWMLQVQQTEPGVSPITITAFKLIFDFTP